MIIILPEYFSNNMFGFQCSMLIISIITAIFLTFISFRRILNLPNFYSYILGVDIWIGILILFNVPWFINQIWQAIGLLILATICFTIFFFILSIPNHAELYFKDKEFLHPTSAYWIGLLSTFFIISLFVLIIAHSKDLISLFKEVAIENQ